MINIDYNGSVTFVSCTSSARLKKPRNLLIDYRIFKMPDVKQNKE